VSGWLRQKDTDEWVKVLESTEVPCGPVYTVDRILADPQIAALSLLKTMPHPTSGQLRFVGAPFHLASDDTEPFLPPPLLLEHTHAVLKQVAAHDRSQAPGLGAQRRLRCGAGERA
jgi:crotonobetainyl-CoA:carnitine CoA-transferase CaiB-like acyl-CoA transferase